MIDLTKISRHQQRWTVEWAKGGFFVPDTFFFESEAQAQAQAHGKRLGAYKPGVAWRTALYVSVESIT